MPDVALGLRSARQALERRRALGRDVALDGMLGRTRALELGLSIGRDTGRALGGAPGGDGALKCPRALGPCGHWRCEAEVGDGAPDEGVASTGLGR